MLQCLLSCQPLCRVDAEELLNQVLDLMRVYPPVVGIKLEVTRLDFFLQILQTFSPKRRVATTENVEQYSARPQITLCVISFLEYFGCYVVWSAKDTRQEFVIFELGRYSEINNFDHYIVLIVSTIYENVLSLQVAVHNILLMAVKNS